MLTSKMIKEAALAAADAISVGLSAKEANLIVGDGYQDETKGYLAKAQEINDKTQSITEDDVMQAVARGKTSFYLAAIRQLCLNIPILFLLDRLFGMTGIVWTQTVADAINVCISYLIFASMIRRKKL